MNDSSVNALSVNTLSVNALSRLTFGLLVLGGGALLLRSRRARFRALAVENLLERPARGKRYAQLAHELEAAGKRVNVRVEFGAPSQNARKTLSHIIGIERWGQRRLRVALGEPLVRDEHHDYKPPRHASWDDLARDFRETRIQTVLLARALSENPPPEGWRAPHNGLGELSARAWLRYLQTHAEVESRRIRR